MDYISSLDPADVRIYLVTRFLIFPFDEVPHGRGSTLVHTQKDGYDVICVNEFDELTVMRIVHVRSE